ncbi:peroxiredoxin [Phaeacidiphilus oryzae]|uniref:peroxiredoxin n=1 Tax=Phaeacidiphilus oryzae TaxID=348818 RepID=UPI0005648DC2|nr:peroxiredoxin [Phaeacidiphilus oryzae]
MAKTPEVGAVAPDFTLPSVLLSGPDGSPQRGELTLSEHRGRPLVLVFYPGDDTPVCTRQLCSYTSELAGFAEVGAEVWAISPQGLDSHEAFARKHGLAFPLLADTGRETARRYGIAVPGLGLRRSVFVLDAAGTVVWKQVGVLGVTFPSAAEITAHVPHGG